MHPPLVVSAPNDPELLETCYRIYAVEECHQDLAIRQIIENWEVSRIAAWPPKRCTDSIGVSPLRWAARNMEMIMPLHDTGVRVPNPATLSDNAMTTNQHGAKVVVQATTEAIKDYGWEMIIDVASKKYDNGDVDSSGLRPIVRVITGDFRPT